MAGRAVSQVFAEQLRKTRERKGWSQSELAARVTDMGSPTHQTAIAKIEKGERKVTVDDIFRLAAALDVSPLALVLPRADDDLVAITPKAAPLPSDSVRAWIVGQLPVTAMPYYDDPDPGRPSEYHTLDGQVLPQDELRDRKRFYETEVSDGQWQLRQDSGLSHLIAVAEQYARERLRGADPALQQASLAHLAAEVERQRELIESEGTD